MLATMGETTRRLDIPVSGKSKKRRSDADVVIVTLGDAEYTARRPKLTMLMTLAAALQSEDATRQYAALFDLIGVVFDQESAVALRTRLNDADSDLDLDSPEFVTMWEKLVEVWTLRPTKQRHGGSSSPQRTGKSSTVRRR